MSQRLKVALAGQPNTGKSTIFNRITGANQEVGNWPGKTVEKKSGEFYHGNIIYEVVDLPGTYSLTSNSEEERITRDYLIKENPDVVIAAVDASQLERTMYFLSEVVMFDIPIVVALNMVDVAEDLGYELDINEMERRLGLKIIPMVASQKIGIEDLKEALVKIEQLKKNYKSIYPKLAEEIEGVLDSILKELETIKADEYSSKWLAYKLIENDTEVKKIVKSRVTSSSWVKIISILDELENGVLLVAEARHNWIEKIIPEGRDDNKNYKKRIHKFDKIATHPILGPITGMAIILVSLIATFTIGGPLMFGVIKLIPYVSSFISDKLVNVPIVLNSMITSGIIPGVGFTISMVFFMMALYFVLGFLEDVGYMARLAYLSDRLMLKMGIHGKSFMPMCMSFVCNVSGILTTRVVDSWRQRMLTIIISIIVPCMAIWGIIGFISVLFFGSKSILVIIVLLVTMVIYMYLSSKLLQRTVLKGEQTGLLMELPPYHKPNFSTIVNYTWLRTKGFLKKAGGFMVGVAFFIWFISYFPNGEISTSYLASIGKFLEPLGKLMGMDWKMLSCLIVGFISKEAVLACMAILFGVANSNGLAITDAMLGGVSFNNAELTDFIVGAITPETAIAFIFALFFSIPCQATLVMIYNETKSYKWTFGILLYTVFTSIFMGTIAYNIASILL